MDVRFDNDTVFTICGPSGSGKTVFVQNLIKHRKSLFREAVGKVHWFYGIVPPPFSPLLILHQGLESGWSDVVGARDMVIIDDLFVESGTNKEVTNAFTRLAHHKPCTLIFITQNLFQRSADSRTRSLNTHYLVLMKNPRDGSQISHISRQMLPNNSQFLTQVFQDVTADAPFSYLLLDFRQHTQ